VQVDPIEQRPADFAEVTLNDAAGATAFVGRIAKVSTRTPVQISTELEHEPRVPAEGDQRFDARQEPAKGRLSASSTGRRPHPAGLTPPVNQLRPAHYGARSRWGMCQAEKRMPNSEAAVNIQRTIQTASFQGHRVFVDPNDAPKI
jgi:hypothetical protein